MPIRLNPTSPVLGRQPSAPPDLNQKLSRARQALARGDLPPAEATKLRSLLALAERALSRGDAITAQQYADEAEKASGSAPGASADSPDDAGDGERPGQANDPGRKDTPANDAQKLGQGERRTYQDVSGDPGVSFKQPTQLTSGQAEVLVRFHERQHLRRETQEAETQGRKVVYAYTAVEYRTDPATGERYIKGGKTVVQTASDRTPKVDRKA